MKKRARGIIIGMLVAVFVLTFGNVKAYAYPVYTEYVYLNGYIGLKFKTPDGNISTYRVDCSIAENNHIGPQKITYSIVHTGGADIGVQLKESEYWTRTDNVAGWEETSRQYVFPFSATVNNIDGYYMQLTAVEDFENIISNTTGYGDNWISFDTDTNDNGMTNYRSDHQFGHATYVIEYTPKSYSVNYDGNGATSGYVVSQSAKYPDEFNLNMNQFKKEYSVAYNINGGTSQNSNSEKVGCQFNGWQCNGNVYGDMQRVSRLTPVDNGVVTMSALWSDSAVKASTAERKYNIKYYTNTSDRCSIDSYVQPVYYTMLGWYTSNTGGVKVADNGGYWTPNGDMVLYAQWKEQSTTLPSPTRAGYKFDGWYADKNGTVKIGNGGDKYTPVSDVSMYAKWSRDIKVTFKLNGGTLNGSSSDILLGGKIYNDTGYYEFSINGNLTDSTSNNSVQSGSIKAFGSGYNSNGINNNIKKETVDSETGDKVEWRFLGWSQNNGNEPDENLRATLKSGTVTYNMCAYNNSKATKIRTYNNITLYAVYEPVLQMKSGIYRTLGGSIERSDKAGASNINGGTLEFRTGEQVKVKNNTIGMINNKGIEIDNKILKMSSIDGELSKYRDKLNNSNIGKIKYNTNNRVNNNETVFYIPQYLLECNSGVNEYIVRCTCEGNSYYWSKYKGQKEKVVVTYKIKIKESSKGGNTENEDEISDENRIDSDLKWKIKM